MRISAVETVIDPDHPVLLWVRVHTDDGLVGLGETAGEPWAAAEAVHGMLAGLLVGEDPTRIEWLWHRCFRALNYRGTGGAELKALSAVDVALWDLLGKFTGQPTYVLLGGACRDQIPAYNTCGNYGSINDRERFLTAPGDLAQELLQEGFQMMKIWPFDEFAEESEGQYITPAALNRGVERVAEIRTTVHDAMEIAIEGHSLWNLPTAIRIAKALEPLDPIWLEDLTWPDNPTVLSELRKATCIPIVASERLMTRFAFRQLIDAGGADIVMLDIAWTGGISEALKIATLASTHLLPVAPHNCGGPVSHVVNLHYCAHIHNLLAVETVRAFYKESFPQMVTDVPVPSGGKFGLPHGPGHGVELRPELLAKSDIQRRLSIEPGREAVGLATSDPWRTAKF